MDAHPPLPPEIWEYTPPGAQELIVAQAAALAQLRAEVAQLKATVAELAQRLGRNSRNSSQPPSADPPQVMRRSRRESSGRRPGGQPGHEGQTREVERLLDAGQTCGMPKTEGICREMLKLRQALWTFVPHEGVEPTNNAAERAIRPGVLWRKGRFGTQSPEGSRFVETMMTVVATLNQQHRNILDYVTAACEAALRGEPAPSLLPTIDDLKQVMHPAA
jgi:hypothetical protein